ncbi:MAG: hypothetical protein IKT65_06655, partial [Clostridia bacterium]|nr:hypothetical protein [Clostridia bacterium]
MFSSPKQLCKRLLSVLLALTFVASPIAVIAEDAAQAFAAKNTEPTALVFATSDFQPRDLSSGDISAHSSFSISAGVGQMQSIINQIDDDYDLTSFTGALHCGDFSNYSKYNSKWYSYAYGNNPVITQDGVSAVEYVLGKNFHLTPEEMVFIQGNHDFYVDPIDYTGAHDTEQYGVYAINEKDFMYQQATVANCEDTVKKTAADLEAYLQAKIDQHYNKPIFIVNHVPLHHNPRSVDNLHSKYLFDVVNAAGAKGLTIIFLFGHNHGSGYDAHIGEGSIYLAPGDTIYIPNGDYDSATGVAGKQKKTLNFVYMNPGYTGYISTKEGGADTTLTSTVFAIYEDKVEIRRYDSTGLHQLKAKGKLLTAYSTTTNHSLYTYTKVYDSPQTISLTEGKFNVSLDTDALYPNKTINSKYLNSATFAADNPTSANSLVSKKTYVNKNVTVPDATGFNVGDKGKIGINCATEEFVIKEVISSNTSVAQVVKNGDKIVYDDAGRFEVEGIGVGTTTITVIAEAVNGEYDDVIITYDLTVFPESSELKPLFYTKYRLTDATKQANQNISDTHITSDSDTTPNITVGKTYVLVTDYKNAVVTNSNGTEAGGWSYALIGTNSSTTTSRNVAVYGTPTVVTSNKVWQGGANGSFIEACDPLMEWTYVGGNRMRNNATGEYLYADGATLKTTGTATADEMYYRFLEGGYGFFLRTSSDTNTHDRRYFRATAATSNTINGKAIVPINVETVNNNTNGDKRYSNNVFIYEKITDGETGAYAWVEGIVDNKITAFTGDVNGATSATLCITDGVNVTRTPLTLNMIHSTSTAVQASTAAGTVGTNFSIVYDGVTLESGLTLTLVDEPEIKFYNRTARIDGEYNPFAEVTSGESVELIFSYEIENTKYVTLKEDGTLTGKEVGGSNVKVSIDIKYPDGTVIPYPETHVSYATTAPKDTCFKQLRTYSQSRDVYVYTESPSNSDTYSKPFLIVSDNTVGDAYVLIGSKSNYNNLNAEKITIESFNGKKFIYTPSTDYNKEWYHINNDGATDTANGFYGLRTVDSPNHMKYALNAVQSWKNSAYTTGDMTGETGLIAVDGSRWTAQVILQYPEGTHTLEGNAGVTGWKYDHANGGFYTGHDSRPRYLLTFRDDIRQFVAVYHGTGTMANTIGKADKTNRVYTFQKQKMETPGIMIWLSDSHGTVSYGADGAAYTGTMVNV